jgi:hypothetical protein
MEPERSLTCSQQPSTAPYPEPDQSSPYHCITIFLSFGSFPKNLSKSGILYNIS